MKFCEQCQKRFRIDERTSPKETYCPRCRPNVRDLKAALARVTAERDELQKKLAARDELLTEIGHTAPHILLGANFTLAGKQEATNG